MTTTTTGSHENEESGGERLGRAAERLARRIAGDARRFAERVEEHASEFAHDVRREWRSEAWRDARSATDDVGRIVGDVRDVLAAVLDGVDEFIGRVFQADPAAPSWTRVVLNRDATCRACGKAVPAGQEAHVRLEGREFRCVDCGPPPSDAPGGQAGGQG